MSPLNQLAQWYLNLNDFDSEHLGYRLGLFLEVPADVLNEFLSGEQLPIAIQLGRTLAARAVIDWYIATDPLDSATDYMLDLVETGDKQDKQLANAALLRVQQRQQDRNRTRHTWSELRQAGLSDSEIRSWARTSLLRIVKPG